MKSFLIFILFVISTTVLDAKTTAVDSFPPVPMFIEEKTFVAGETVTLDVWSEEVLNLSAWQFRLGFDNAEILEISPSVPFSEIPNNIINDKMTINTLWFSDSGLPIDIELNETWFTLTVVPEIDGSTLDIFSTENDPWSFVALIINSDLTEVEVDFSFQIEERNVLVSTDPNIETSKLQYNNPVHEQLIIKDIDEICEECSFSIYNLYGQKIKSRIIKTTESNLNIDVSKLPVGLYFLNVGNGTQNQTLKFYKI